MLQYRDNLIEGLIYGEEELDNDIHRVTEEQNRLVLLGHNLKLGELGTVLDGDGRREESLKIRSLK